MLFSILQSAPEFDPTIAEEFGYAVEQGLSFLGVPVLDLHNLLHLIIRFAFNLLVSWIIIKQFYYRKSQRRDYFLTFLIFASAMFLLIFLMGSVKLEIGLTLGLFAIFGVIRYRTETVPIREMTYLFIIITTSVINGLAMEVSYSELIAANALIILLIWFVEFSHSISHLNSKTVVYDKIENIVPEKREELIADLQKRIGVKIEKVEIGSVDFLKDSAFIKVYYKGDYNTVDNVTKLKNTTDQ